MLTNIYPWFKTKICPEFPYYSLSLSDGRVKEDISHHNNGFHFRSFLLHGFHFFVVLVMGSFDFLCSRIHLGLSLRLDGLEQIQEEGWRWFRENGAWSRPSSRPKWSSILDWPLSLLHGFSFFLFFFCFWVVSLIMIWLWWGYGLWLVVVVDCGRGGGGAKLWVLIAVVEKKLFYHLWQFLTQVWHFPKANDFLRSHSNSD